MWLWLSCATLSASVREVKLLRIDEPRLTVDLAVGQILTVRTAPVPLTAFRWVHVPSADKVVAFLEADVDAVESAQALPGGLHEARFSFKAAMPGCTRLAFAYFAGPSFPGFEQRDQFEVSVCVKR